MSESQEQNIRAIQRERKRQDKKWGVQNHEPELWLVILGEEYGEACQAALADMFGRKNQVEKKHSQLRIEIEQVAAVALAMLEWMDRSGYDKQETPQ